MKKYAGQRPLEEIIKIVSADGWSINRENYDNGGEHIRFYRSEDTIVYNITDGSFSVKWGNIITGSHSHQYDNEEWFQNILDILYLPFKEDVTRQQQ